jgi:phospholipid transport system transporter-binding protein
MFRPPPTLTIHNAALVRESGLHAIAQGQSEIDLSELQAVDSAAVATLLAWRRAAARRGVALGLRGLPANLQSLVALYGVQDLIHAEGLGPGGS